MALDSKMRLAAMAPEGSALLDSLLVLDGEGDRFALRTKYKGQYLALRPDRTIGCRMAGWGGFSDDEVFEIVVEETDNGDRVSIRAPNGKFIGVDPSTGLIIAAFAEMREDELLKVIPRSMDASAPSLEPATSLRVGARTFEERAELNSVQFRDRGRRFKRDLVQALLLRFGIQKMTDLATHVWWSCDQARLLLELPGMMAAAGAEWVTIHLTNLLRNLFYCSAVAAVGGLSLLQSVMREHSGRVAEACHELPHSNNPDEQPEGIAQGVQKLLKFITDQGQELHQAPDTLLWRLLKHPMPRSLGKSLSDDIERVKASVKEIMKAAQTVKPDMVPLIGIKRRLQTLRDVGAIKAMGLADQCKELLEAIDDKVRALRIKPDEVVSAFANKHMRTQQEKAINSRNKVCAAHNFELLADALYRAKDEVIAPRCPRVMWHDMIWRAVMCCTCARALILASVPVTGRGLCRFDGRPPGRAGGGGCKERRAGRRGKRLAWRYRDRGATHLLRPRHADDLDPLCQVRHEQRGRDG